MRCLGRARKVVALDDDEQRLATIDHSRSARRLSHKVAAGGTTNHTQVVTAHPDLRADATSAAAARLASPRLLTGVETGSQEVARGLCDSLTRNQKPSGYSRRNR